MDTQAAPILSVEHNLLTLKQLLQRLQVDPAWGAIDRCTDDLTVELWAGSLGLAADDDELQAALTAFRRARGLFTAAHTGEWLQIRGMTLDDLAAMLRPQLLRAALSSHVVSDEEIRRHFRETAQRYDRAEISFIVTAEYGMAQELRFRLEEGGDFHTLARRYSEDAATAKSGGYAGLVGRGDLEPETAAALFGSEAGAVLGPFELKRRYSLIAVEALFPAELNDDVRADIRERLFVQKLEEYRQTLHIQKYFGSLGEG